MTELWLNMILPLILSLLAGVLLGGIYFGGLALTVRVLPRSSQPALLMLASYILRVAILLVGFYFVMGGSWERLVACLVGFIIARMILIRAVKPAVFDTGHPDTEGSTN